MDKKRFFDAIRPAFGGSLYQAQVDGINAILAEAERQKIGLNSVAYALATARHETGGQMLPVTERGKRSYFDKYEPGTKIGQVLGNTIAGDGYRFRGRGPVQLTGRRNYAVASKKLGVDLLSNPDLALQPGIGAKVLIVGMREGWFTGKRIEDFIDDIDEADDEDLREFIAARRIVNGTDKAETIGRYALRFEKALRAAGYDGQAVELARPLTVRYDPFWIGLVVAVAIAVGFVAWILMRSLLP